MPNPNLDTFQFSLDSEEYFGLPLIYIAKNCKDTPDPTSEKRTNATILSNDNEES